MKKVTARCQANLMLAYQSIDRISESFFMYIPPLKQINAFSNILQATDKMNGVQK